jgi:glycosyltransferase involved in cell wall biosynthesis
VEVVGEARKGLVIARETGRRQARGDVLVYLDADCRAPIWWLQRIERRFAANTKLAGLTGPYRFYDWDVWGRLAGATGVSRCGKWSTCTGKRVSST